MTSFRSPHFLARATPSCCSLNVPSRVPALDLSICFSRCLQRAFPRWPRTLSFRPSDVAPIISLSQHGLSAYKAAPCHSPQYFSSWHRSPPDILKRDCSLPASSTQIEAQWEWELKSSFSSATSLRQAGAWDPGPFAAVLPPGQMSLEQQTSKKLQGLRRTACVCSWDKWWTIQYKGAKTQLPLLRCWNKSRLLPMIPVHSTTHKGGRPPTPPFHCTHGSAPTLTPLKRPARFLVFTPSATSPKALLEFLNGPLTNFYWLKRLSTQVSNILNKSHSSAWKLTGAQSILLSGWMNKCINQWMNATSP